MRKKLIVPDGLLYVTDEKPGIRRIKKKTVFIYLDPKKKVIKSNKTLNRINNLKIPPIWKSVWICIERNGHLQATGRDLKKRKQYIYHQKWNEHSSANKFSKLLEFGKALSSIREKYKKDLNESTWSQKKVLALAVALMDELHLRIGNDYYYHKNNTHGLTTLRRKHLTFDNKEVQISYKAKKGVHREIVLCDEKLCELLKKCSELPGYEIFTYKENNQTKKIDSSGFNSYINVNATPNFTAKDFRTWAGSLYCIEFIDEAEQICLKNKRRKKETTLLNLIANRLGNTISICREYYVHPYVLKFCLENNMKEVKKAFGTDKNSMLSSTEQILLKILTNQNFTS